MPRLGPIGLPELLIILVVVLLIFGPRRLPEMAKGIGQSVREFRKGLRDMKDDFESAAEESDVKAGKTAGPAGEAQAAATPAATEVPTAEIAESRSS